MADQEPRFWKPSAEWVASGAESHNAQVSESSTQTEVPQGYAGKGDEDQSEIQVGDTNVSFLRRVSPYIRLLVMIAVLGLVIYLVGLWRRGQLSGVVDQVWPSRRTALILVDSRDDMVLIWETRERRSEVLVQTSPQGSWLRISRDDFTAINPTLSPAGDQVAYLSSLDSGQVVIASLDVTIDRTLITADQLESAAAAAGHQGVTFCGWTPLAWSPDGQRLAFFACRMKTPRSMAFVAQLDADPPELALIPDSAVDVSDERQLLWSGDDHVVLSFPALDGEQIETLPVP